MYHTVLFLRTIPPSRVSTSVVVPDAPLKACEGLCCQNEWEVKSIEGSVLEQLVLPVRCIYIEVPSRMRG